MKKPISKKGRIALIVLIFLVVGLVGLRAVLPTLIENQINKTLAHSLENYTGSIEDFDLALWRGTYFVEGLKLKKRTAPPDQYMVKIGQVEVDVAWQALFERKLLLDVLLLDPEITIFDAEDKNAKQDATGEKNWMEAIRSIIPFKLQTLEVDNGSLAFRKMDIEPAVGLEVDKLNLSLHNLGDVDETFEGRLPTEFSLSGRFQKQADLSASGKLRLHKKPWRADLSADLTSFKIPSLNDFFRAYGFFDVTRGELAANMKLKANWPDLDVVLGVRGKGLDVVAPQQAFMGFRGVVTELGLALVNLIARDPENKVISTQIKIEGEYPNLKVNTWEAVKGLFDDRK